MRTKIAIACDDIGFERKEELVKYLIEQKDAEIVYDPVKTPADGQNTFAKLADQMCELIQRDVCRLGIYICGTGIGFTCQANKHWGIRAVMVSNPTPHSAPACPTTRKSLDWASVSSGRPIWSRCWMHGMTTPSTGRALARTPRGTYSRPRPAMIATL